MENKVFREKSMDQISSTDELHDYMRVTSPQLWMILSVILVLIIGFIVAVITSPIWGIPYVIYRVRQWKNE